MFTSKSHELKSSLKNIYIMKPGEKKAPNHGGFCKKMMRIQTVLFPFESLKTKYISRVMRIKIVKMFFNRWIDLNVAYFQTKPIERYSSKCGAWASSFFHSGSGIWMDMNGCSADIPYLTYC